MIHFYTEKSGHTLTRNATVCFSFASSDKEKISLSGAYLLTTPGNQQASMSRSARRLSSHMPL